MTLFQSLAQVRLPACTTASQYVTEFYDKLVRASVKEWTEGELDLGVGGQEISVTPSAECYTNLSCYMQSFSLEIQNTG